ncbi:MAG: TniQ family protein, partial [Cytophagia bacterium]|nr:TniQ family protein [Cytophagia bacterium]
MNNNNDVFVKPLLYPPIKSDESPVGYLLRIATINGYDSFRWLYKSDKRVTTSPFKLYEEILETKWMKASKDSRSFKEIKSVSTGVNLTKRIRFCPLCLEEDKYIRDYFHYRVTVVCSKHQVWLHDTCPCCNRELTQTGTDLEKCKCGQLLCDIKTENAPLESIELQRFIEGEYVASQKDKLILNDKNSMTFDKRIELVSFFSRWLKDREMITFGASRSLAEMKTARNCMLDVAEALFTGQYGFHNFLSRLNIVSNNFKTTKGKLSVFTRFYRGFYKNFTESYFDPFKNYIELFINSYWNNSLSGRNKQFNSDTINKHPWIPLRRACIEYDLPKSLIKRAISNNLIKYREVTKAKRVYTLIYQPDLVDRLGRLKSLITSKDARIILGLTKLQFTQLRESGCFKFCIPPESNGSHTWQFFRDEIMSYRDKFIQSKNQVAGNTWTFQQLLQFFGGRIEQPLPTILNAVEKQELKIAAINDCEQGLSSALFNRKEFLNWYETLRDN